QISCGVPWMRPSPEASITAISGAACSTTGEKACAQATSSAGSAEACMQAYITHLSTRLDAARAGLDTAHESAGPVGRVAAHFHYQRSAGFGQRLLGDDHDCRRRIFHGAAQAKP